MIKYTFTSEAVSEGHPDKVADAISDAILDAALALDPCAHVAAESFVGRDFAANLGEISMIRRDDLDTEKIVRGVVRDIGYDQPNEGFCWNTLHYEDRLAAQSPDIAMGVNRDSPESQGAGDQGMMFGYAVRETPELMPAPIAWAHRLMRRFTAERKSGRIPWLRPDAKSQVTVGYDEFGRPARIAAIVLSHQTTAEPDMDRVIRPTIEAVIRDELADTGMIDGETRFYVNPTGRFVIGGPAGDSGLTGRKIVVDTYGGSCPHGGGAFSGKDPSKVDRSAAYYARYAAKNFVAAGVADRCEIQVSYAIGVPAPVGYRVDFFGTVHGGASEEKAVELLKSGEIFDFRPGKLVAELGLTSPKGWSYRDTTNGGHFGRDSFPWERTDKVEAIRSFFDSAN